MEIISVDFRGIEGSRKLFMEMIGRWDKEGILGNLRVSG